MTKKELHFADALVKACLESFDYAYTLHQHGQSVDSLLIYHDIIAAARDTDPKILRLHQRAIRSACEAFDAGVPLQHAHVIVRWRMEKWIKQNEKKKI
jgi:hypothetical protein